MKNKLLKFPITILILLLSFSLFGCGSESSGSSDKNNKDVDENLEYPEKPITLVVPAEPGGGSDGTARLLAKQLGDQMGTNIKVVNMAGGGGTVALDHVKNSEPDGYTAIYFHGSILTNHLLGAQEYLWNEAIKVGGISSGHNDLLIVARKDAPYDNLEEMKEYVNSGGKVNFAIEAATMAQVISTNIQEELGIDLNMIDFGGAGPRVAALVGKKAEVTQAGYLVVKDYLDTGEFKVLAAIGDERSDALPEVPTLKEQGIDASFNIFNFVGFPVDTVDEVVDIFSENLKATVESSEFEEGIKKLGENPKFMDQSEATEFMETESEKLIKMTELMLESEQ